MSALNSTFILIDLQTSWYSAKQIANSTFCYLNQSQSQSASSTFSAAFRRTRNRRSKISSIQSPEIRRPKEHSISGNGLSLFSPNSPSISSSGDEVVSDLDLFLEIVPLRMRNELFMHQEIGKLIEVVMDLGRKPLARFPSGDWIISEQPVKLEDLRHAISKVGDFSDDNRSGIDSSLHRISAIRNRKMQIIGLTCRVGRAVSGSAEIIRDLVEGGGSILVIGPPGVGKTTLIREIARMLADDQKRRVVIVDTSNEIGGDGDVPHSGIGCARRMQVPNVNLQHNVMIEAVENHMPQTIIIDEIGTELEALAASTIAQRGVQLVGTAHGSTIESIIKNPSLQMLVGGIESVTLGDEEARKRKVQKTILERKGPPTFTCAVEMISRTECRVHHRLDLTVDAILAGKSPLFEIRRLESEAENLIESSLFAQEDQVNDFELTDKVEKKDRMEYVKKKDKVESDREYVKKKDKVEYVNYNLQSNNEDKKVKFESDEEDDDHPNSTKLGTSGYACKRTTPVHVYTYKIQEADLLQVATVMGLEEEIEVTDDIGIADAILASSVEMKQNPWIRSVAKFHQVPVFVVKSSTMAQMVKAIRMILGMDSLHSKQPLKDSFDIAIQDDAPKRRPTLEEIDALEEVRLAIEYIVIPGGEAVELLPRRSEIVAQQLKLVESYQLAAENSGTESNPRLQILPQKLYRKTSVKPSRSSSSGNNTGSDSWIGKNGGTGVARLPFLPE
ncbi:protein SEEDLING PLASTID DEVELOPMENT 1 isoform X1 [Lycium ferocissimum]|uniref:protein SEEDLING PLASTID DEVELOPMENT 1 isoform X1 n=2 Tax=Lycium ferocissimum TaxID=112874 RepID=UPI002814FCE5|nr:protein SEEDLING PLASTID DEVELOPMENT 1 isoform X1 [Lycium ferocissimum]